MHLINYHPNINIIGPLLLKWIVSYLTIWCNDPPACIDVNLIAFYPIPSRRSKVTYYADFIALCLADKTVQI